MSMPQGHLARCSQSFSESGSRSGSS